MVDVYNQDHDEELPESLRSLPNVGDKPTEEDSPEVPVEDSTSGDEAESVLEAQREQDKQDRAQALKTGRPVIREAREGFGGEYMGEFTPAPTN